MSKLQNLLPFMEESELKELALKIISGEVKGIKLFYLYPFLGREARGEIIDLLIEKKMGRQLKLILPFSNADQVNLIMDRIADGTLTDIKDTDLFPFLGREKMKEIFDRLVDEAMKNADNEDEDSENEDESEDE